eukprot:TRINITY_DN46_c1_g1_i4.p1 TRINITY_DN46_c1_g1~~TRINITY_DN46_c1_g1_i4.p1  ORF type:complete len:284 (-),score=54.98 TRINITY_DN46_c1_g1_i4:802-1653(-)
MDNTALVTLLSNRLNPIQEHPLYSKMMSFITFLVLAPVARGAVYLIVGNATNEGVVEASTNSSGTGDFTLGFTNEAFDSIFNGNLTTGVGRVRSFRVTVSNTTGPGEQESTGASNTSTYITTGGQFQTDGVQLVESSSNNNGVPQQGLQNATTATFTSGQTLGFSRVFNASDPVGTYAGNQFSTISYRLGAGLSQSDGEGLASTRVLNAPENILTASRSQGQTQQSVEGNNILSYAEGELFSASGSEETGSGCAVRGGVSGQTVDTQNSQAACVSSGFFYDRN